MSYHSWIFFFFQLYKLIIIRVLLGYQLYLLNIYQLNIDKKCKNKLNNHILKKYW